MRLYICPHVGDIPLNEFTLDAADLVRANIPETKSSATRRQIAQVVRRVLGLAVYPARYIKENPIPRGWLHRRAARTWAELELGPLSPLDEAIPELRLPHGLPHERALQRQRNRS